MTRRPGSDTDVSQPLLAGIVCSRFVILPSSAVCVFCRPGRLRAVDRVYVVRMAASRFILSRIPAAAILLLCIATVTYLSAVGLMWFLVLKIHRVVLSNLCTLSQ